MTVRAKFKVESFETRLDNRPLRDENGQQRKDEHGGHLYERVEVRSVKMVPVYGDKAGTENAAFWTYTPSGSITLGTINPEAWAQLPLGAEVYIDFTPADA